MVEFLDTEILKKWEILSFLNRIIGIRMFTNNGKIIYNTSALSRIKIIFMCSTSIYFWFGHLSDNYIIMDAKITMLSGKIYVLAHLVQFIIGLIKPTFIRPMVVINLLRKFDKVEKDIDNNFFTKNLRFIYRMNIVLFLIIYCLFLGYCSNSVLTTSCFIWQIIELLVNEILMLKCICSTVLIIFYISCINDQLIFQLRIDRNFLMSPFWNFIGINNFCFEKITDKISPRLVKKIIKIYMELFDCVEIICYVNDVTVSIAVIVFNFKLILN